MWRRLLIVSAFYGCFLNVQVFPDCVQWYSSVPRKGDLGVPCIGYMVC